MISHWFGQLKGTLVTPLLLALLFTIACGAAATATPVPAAPAVKEVVPAAPAAPAA
jgi:hypothetical protein